MLKRGRRDALRAYHSETIYTFWKYLRNAYARDAGLRIDHLLLSPAAARMKGAAVDQKVRSWDKGGDDAPVWVELSSV